MSNIVNVKKAELRKLGYRDLEHWLAASPNHVYVGRDMTRYVNGAVGSKWGNPFSVGKYGRDECFKKFTEYVRANHELMNSIHELDGKILGCWCYPEKCHSEILLKLVEEYKNNPKN